MHTTINTLLTNAANLLFKRKEMNTLYIVLPLSREPGIYHYPWQNPWAKGFYPGGFSALPQPGSTRP
jgi:hypothetical protein